MFLLFLPVVPESLFARSYLLSPNACIIFLRHCGMKICVVGGHNIFFSYACGFGVVLIIWIKTVCKRKLVKMSTRGKSTAEPLPCMPSL